MLCHKSTYLFIQGSYGVVRRATTDDSNEVKVSLLCVFIKLTFQISIGNYNNIS